MVKYVDNNYRQFQKERKSKGNVVDGNVLNHRANMYINVCTAGLAPHDQSIHEFNKYVS